MSLDLHSGPGCVEDNGNPEGQGVIASELTLESENPAAADAAHASKDAQRQPKVPEGLDPSFFWLSDEEKENALDIKEAIESLPDLDNLSDFMYANMALVWDVATAVEHAYILQEVRMEYKVPVTFEDGVRALTELFETIPLYFLSYMFDLRAAKSVLVMDLSSIGQRLMRDPKNVEKIIRGASYVCYATIPTLDIVRKGKNDIFEFGEFQWGKGMVDLKCVEQVTVQTIGAFPANFQAHFYHTPMMANVFVSMWKKVIPKEVADKFHVGFRFAGGRLSNFYLLPTPEVATKKTLANLIAGLKIRLDSEKMFSLDADYGSPPEEGNIQDED
ncbi:expressed unknown protein [Seminavis robusta]|uniref:Uncharacterized protein n=1 Tax=Seminavis robusta TaxID=568900 RepID=A0A9N8HX53_9STRA|nr:expressed unknown protein [Seminavis robusta]|eukprot:Sro2362_g324890.1 n/a (331) ;mRNA; r:11999-13092